MDATQVVRTVETLRAMEQENECAEFKHNNANPEDIGEYISALANSAALMKEPTGFIIWGIDDATHEIIGTSFKPHKEKIGNEELENWLLKLLAPRLDIKIHEVEIGGEAVVVFEVPAARHTSIRFRDTELIRVGS